MNAPDLKIAVVGATGLVGRTILKVLAERQLPCAELFPIASPKSQGQKLTFRGRDYLVTCPEDGTWRQADVVLLSAGADVSRSWVPEIAARGITCIDNSSAFRRDKTVPLVVPEVNPEALKEHRHIIANPNCSTIQLVMIAAPLHRRFNLEELVVATYQSASGAGQKGKVQLQSERIGEKPAASEFPHRLFDNLIPGIGSPVENGFYTEEEKLIFETRKILGLPELRVFPTAVRVPINHCHGEAVHLCFRRKVDPVGARDLLSSSSGIRVVDEPREHSYPLPLDCMGSDDVCVGRIRGFPDYPRSLDLWIVADNLLKGAATNAVQILEQLLRKKLLRRSS